MLSRLAERLTATRRTLGQGFARLVGTPAVTGDAIEELEATLLQADVGIEATRQIVEQIRQAPGDSALDILRQALIGILQGCEQPLAIDDTHHPYVILVVGVNGAGKSTTIGKIAHFFQADGKKVMLAAGDTFRAAAVEQLRVWGERSGVPVIAQEPGADAAAVAHDALNAAKARGMDVLIVDTAGRLHTQAGLMEELKKIRRALGKIDASAPHETMLVLDAGIGQNGIVQLEKFDSAVGVTGIVLSKLDGTAKGGVVFAIAGRRPIPIRFIGVGETIGDLRVFNAVEFVDALLPEVT